MITGNPIGVSSENLAKALNEAVDEITKRKIEISEKAALDCILQAIKCGDFMHFIKRNLFSLDEEESFTYEPYRVYQDLLRERDTARAAAESMRNAHYTVCSLSSRSAYNSIDQVKELYPFEWEK